jgi:hypothetical protein
LHRRRRGALPGERSQGKLEQGAQQGSTGRGGHGCGLRLVGSSAALSLIFQVLDEAREGRRVRLGLSSYLFVGFGGKWHFSSSEISLLTS